MRGGAKPLRCVPRRLNARRPRGYAGGADMTQILARSGKSWKSATK